MGGVGEDDDYFVETGVEVVDENFCVGNIVDEVAVNVHLECFVVL